tara:strand:- start:1736 stop:2497 length:762 start_codon:yes stop_codon:yes gene_type:complete
MTITRINKIYAPIKKYLPNFLSRYLRRIVTGLLTPISFAMRSGHFKSSMLEKSVNKSGKPIPWLTFPCIDFLENRSLSNKSVLEFGGGQSTIYFSNKVRKVITFEEDEKWAEYINSYALPNSKLYYVPYTAAGSFVDSEIISTIGRKQINFIEETLERDFPNEKFNIIIVDGLIREAVIQICEKYLDENGAIICDDAGGYSFQKDMNDSGLNRVDFYGHSPGVYHHTCTSIYYKKSCDLFSAQHKIINNLYSK